MKSCAGHCFGVTQYLVLFTWLVCTFLPARPNDVRAETQNELADRVGKSSALQELLAKERPKGPIFVAIPIAYRYGIGGVDEAYCSPSIRATNSSNTSIEELIIGIDYVTAAGKAAGASITRYANIKVQQQDTHFFYQLDVPDCRGLQGYVSIVRCVYSTGEDCSSAVQAVGFGTIPLRLKPH